MASTARSEGKGEEAQVYTVEKERQDWATVWTMLRSFRSIARQFRYGGLAASYRNTGDALQALKRLNDHRATK